MQQQGEQDGPLLAACGSSVRTLEHELASERAAKEAAERQVTSLKYVWLLRNRCGYALRP